MNQGMENCKKKYPNRADPLHSDFNDFKLCISTNAGIAGMATGMFTDPIGSAASAIGSEMGCEDKCE
ncbi:MAG: hypothetical protein JAY74_27930 [Candidatus Thiodiazotropha taylori]|nr:hypothetical protein [Candidatus Thiodiazotropha taylori]